MVEVVDISRPVMVTARLWNLGAIAGRVIDDYGEPVAGVPVTAMRRYVIGGAMVLRRESTDAETDDRGAYRIASLPVGSYVVGVRSTARAHSDLPASHLAPMS